MKFDISDDSLVHSLDKKRKSHGEIWANVKKQKMS